MENEAESIIAQQATELMQENAARQEEVTRRKRSERELLTARSAIQDIIEHLDHAFVGMDHEWRFTYVNEEALRLTGMSREIIGKNLWDIMPWLAGTQIEARLTRVMTERAEVKFEDFNERRGRWSTCRAVPFSTGIAVFLRDITEQKKAGEEQKRAEEERIRALEQAVEERKQLVTAIEHAAEGFYLMQADGIIAYVNRAFCAMAGYEKNELIGNHIAMTHSDKVDPAVYEAIWERLGTGNMWSGRGKRKRKDGTIFDVETAIVPIKDPTGKIVTHVAVTRDITEEMALEEHRTQSQKMEAIGTLAGGIAHDFNNVLAAIMGNAELALDDIPADAPPHFNLQQILKAAARGRDLVRHILTFTRKSKGEKQIFSLGPLIKETYKLLRASVPTTIDMSLSIETQSDTVEADPVQIQQVLLNLVKNAADAMRDKIGSISTRLWDVTLVTDDQKPDPEMAAGDYLALAVTDTGSGLTEKVKKRIFEPFFTTKKPGEGTGMGLAVVYGIMKENRGAVTVSSRYREGATFTIYLPKLTTAKKAEEEVVRPVQEMGKERVLFVDDEEALVMMAKAMLGRLGYEVTALSDSAEALSVFTRNPDAFDIVITDQTMPKMTGTVLAKQLKELRPDIPIILCSGYNDLVSLQMAGKHGIHGYVRKPFQKDEFAKAVRAALSEDARK